MSLESTPPKVFISYSHNYASPDYKDSIWDLAKRLLHEGIDCTIDQHEESPPEGWQRWMLNQVEQSDFVLIACTAEYDRRFRGNEPYGKGKGATWEGGVIIQELYDAQGHNSKFIPIILNSEDSKFIPSPLRSATRYGLYSGDGYELLYRRLTNQPKNQKPELGKLRTLPPLPLRDRKQDFPTNSVEVVISGVENTEDNEGCDLDSKTSWEDWKIRRKNIGFQECKQYPGFIEKKSIHPLDSSFCIENEYVKIQSFLPNLNKNDASGIITFKDNKFKDIIWGFKHLSLLEEYFPSYQSSLDTRISCVFDDKDSPKYQCQIGETRVTLLRDEAQSLYDAFDRLCENYKERIAIIEKQWRSSNFDILSGFGDGIPLIRITQELWFILYSFAYHHDYLDSEDNELVEVAKCHKDTEEKWAIFNQNGEKCLNVFTKTTTPQYHHGYHVSIKSRQSHKCREHQFPSDEVLLLWQPSYDPEEHHNEFSSRYYWDVETTYDWLVNELIPYALFWNKEIRQTKKLAQSIKKASYENFLKEYNKNDYLTDSYKQKPFQLVTVENLKKLVSDLQKFFYFRKPYHFSVKEYSNLYMSLFLSLTYSNCDDYHYLLDNLRSELFSNSKNITELRLSLEQNAKEVDESLCNYNRIEGMFRCISFCLQEESNPHLTKQEIEKIAEFLKPFSEKLHHAKFLERQIARLSKN